MLGGVWSGIDSCEPGAVCWPVSSYELEGTCFAFCSGDENAPTCEDHESECKSSDAWPFLVCVPRCDPLQQDCPAGQACHPVNDDWNCVPDASGDAGGYADPCDFLNVCAPGHVCLAADAVPLGEACQGAVGCCTALCDLSDPLGDAQCEGMVGGQTCQPWYEEGNAPPGYEDVGVCTLPA